MFSLLLVLISASQSNLNQLSVDNTSNLQKVNFNTTTLYKPIESNIISPSLSLAESLYNQNDYFNAITEFERYLFYNPDASNKQEIKYKLALSYFYCQETLKTERILQELSSEEGRISQQAQWYLVQMYLNTKKHFKAKLELNDLLIRDNNQNKAEIYRALGYIALQEQDPKTALEYFMLAQDSWLINKTNNLIRLPKKNISLAQLLSTLVPGSGEMYCGRYVWGILSFLVNSVTIYGTIYSFKHKQYLDASLIFSIFFTRFYNGSRNNARDFAIEFNTKIYQKALREIEKVFELDKISKY
ncbi:MAG: hypothetical protein N2201_04040 [candidate division WOR-3 bacterium]|nr:hypothetical protein [candidate division WOR-3 bacterium]